jgi:hypothetical protein
MTINEQPFVDLLDNISFWLYDLQNEAKIFRLFNEWQQDAAGMRIWVACGAT